MIFHSRTLGALTYFGQDRDSSARHVDELVIDVVALLKSPCTSASSNESFALELCLIGADGGPGNFSEACPVREQAPLRCPSYDIRYRRSQVEVSGERRRRPDRVDHPTRADDVPRRIGEAQKSHRSIWPVMAWRPMMSMMTPLIRPATPPPVEPLPCCRTGRQRAPGELYVYCWHAHGLVTTVGLNRVEGSGSHVERR